MDKIVTVGHYLAVADGPYSEKQKLVFLAHGSAAVKSGTVTADADGYIWVYFSSDEDRILSLRGTGVKVQIEKGSTATAYEPYTGGKPSPSPEHPQPITSVTKAEVVVSGKNLVITDGATKSGWNIKLPNLKLLRGQKYTYKAPVSKQRAALYVLASDIKLTEFLLPKETQTFTVPEEADFSKGCFISGGTSDALDDMQVVISSIVVEFGSSASDFTAPAKVVRTPIDLQGHELRSLSGVVRDELVVDGEGNVSLVRRTGETVYACHQVIAGTGRNYAVTRQGAIPDLGANYTPLLAERAVGTSNGQLGSCYVNGSMIYVVVPPEVTTPEQANELYGGMKVLYTLNEPQTVDLGPVELPKLPSAVSNVWADADVPTEVSVGYRRDVNVVVRRLEEAVGLMASMMDEPTLIPEA